MNVTFRHGVASSLALERTGDRGRALAARNPEVAPHLSFFDMSGQGYAVVRAGDDALDVEFIAIPPPLERSAPEDGGPVAYRIAHRVALWKAGEAPRLVRTKREGNPPLDL